MPPTPATPAAEPEPTIVEPDDGYYKVDPSHRHAAHGKRVKEIVKAAGLAPDEAEPFIHLAMKHGKACVDALTKLTKNAYPAPAPTK